MSVRKKLCQPIDIILNPQEGIIWTRVSYLVVPPGTRRRDRLTRNFAREEPTGRWTIERLVSSVSITSLLRETSREDDDLPVGIEADAMLPQHRKKLIFRPTRDYAVLGLVCAWLYESFFLAYGNHLFNFLRCEVA